MADVAEAKPMVIPPASPHSQMNAEELLDSGIKPGTVLNYNIPGE